VFDVGNRGCAGRGSRFRPAIWTLDDNEHWHGMRTAGRGLRPASPDPPFKVPYHPAVEEKPPCQERHFGRPVVNPFSSRTRAGRGKDRLYRSDFCFFAGYHQGQWSTLVSDCRSSSACTICQRAAGSRRLPGDRRYLAISPAGFTGYLPAIAWRLTRSKRMVRASSRQIYTELPEMVIRPRRCCQQMSAVSGMVSSPRYSGWPDGISRQVHAGALTRPAFRVIMPG